jgi:hydroxymethylpyrimidine pyrophosphatase-like HAD family hydrolase
MTGEQLHDAAGELAHLATATYSSGTLLEISATGVTKAFTLEHLAAEHDLTAAEAVAFGDMPNDIALLEWAHRGIAVANAHPDVLAIADEVTLSNDEDGVAVVIERIVST